MKVNWLVPIVQRIKPVRFLSNDLPPGITKKGEHYYKGPVKLKTKKISLEEFFGVKPK